MVSVFKFENALLVGSNVIVNKYKVVIQASTYTMNENTLLYFVNVYITTITTTFKTIVVIRLTIACTSIATFIIHAHCIQYTQIYKVSQSVGYKL